MSEPPYRGGPFPPQRSPGRSAPYGAGGALPGAQARHGDPYGHGAPSAPSGAGFAAYGPPQQPYGGRGGQGGYGPGGPGGQGGQGGRSWGPPPRRPAPPPAPYGGHSGHGGPPAGSYDHHDEPHPAADLPLAPIHRRALARVMDAGLVWAFGFALVFPIAIGAIGSDGGAKGGDDGGGWTTASLVTTFIVMAVLPFVYEAVQLSLWGQTLGKRVMALSVVRVQPAGDPLPMSQAAWRAAINNVGYQLAIFLFLLIGVTLFKYALILMVLVAVGVLIAYLWAIFDRPLQQTIHDRFAGTVVVDDRVEVRSEDEYE